MIRVHRDLVAAEADWRAAEAGLVHHAFQRFDWLSSWQDTLGAAQGISPLVVVVTGAEGTIRLLLPLGIARWRGLRALVLPGAPVSDYRGAMIARDFDPAEFPALWRDILAALPPVDVVRFDRMPADVEGLSNPLIQLPGAEPSEQAWSTLLPDRVEAFWQSRKARLVSDSRRQRRRLEEIGPIRFEVASEAADMVEVLAVMKAEKSRRWLETGNPDGFADPALGAFYDLASRRMAGKVHGSLLRVGETPVAAHWGMVHAGRFYLLMISSRAGEWTRFSVGRLLTGELVAASIAAGLRVFDLTVGDEAYKKDWADRMLPLWEVRHGVTVRGRAALAAEAAWRAVRARAREVGWLRDILRRVRGRRAAQRQGGADHGA